VWEEIGMDELAKPFVDMWTYIDRVGGFPGKVFFCISVIFVVLGAMTWYGNRR
jgi:hypothetical protein